MNTAKDLMLKRAEFAVTGTIRNITGEANKVYGQKGWMGSETTITLKVNGTTQRIKVFGGVGKDEFPIKAFLKDAEGNIMRDADKKALSQQLPIDAFDPTRFICFDTREVMEWGERNAEGKAEKITHISELSDGRFANALLSKKDSLINRRVMIKGEVSFKPSQNFDKVQLEMKIKTITLLKPVEEGKEVVDKFVVNGAIILNTEALNEVVNQKLPVFVPLYHKYVNGVVNGSKGRTVYVPTTFEVKENGFMAIDQSFGYNLEMRKDMLEAKIKTICGDSPFVVMQTCLVNKSGVTERELNIDDLLQDPVYGQYAQKAIENNNVENFLKMYKLQNPLTVRSEYKQEIDFISPMQIQDETTKMVRDAIFPIDRQAFEIYTLEKIKEETELMKSQKEQQQTPIINTPKRQDVPAPPVLDINNMEDMDSFPF